jgi:hypothetical protein
MILAMLKGVLHPEEKEWLTTIMKIYESINI